MSWFSRPGGRPHLSASMFAEHQAIGVRVLRPARPQSDVLHSGSRRGRLGGVSNHARNQSADGSGHFRPPNDFDVHLRIVAASTTPSTRTIGHSARPVLRPIAAQYFDADEIFGDHAPGLDFSSGRFGHRYPFGKYDQLFVPEFAGARWRTRAVSHNERMVSGRRYGSGAHGPR